MALGVFAASATAVAEVPTTFNFQGRLTDTKNEPVTSTVDVTFEIFDVPQGGTPLHTEVMSITPDQGYFNVRIGADLTNPIQKAVVNGKKALWYQVTFAGVKQQRVMFDAVPYALGAQVASTADTALFAFQADSANYATKAGEASPVGPAGGVLSGTYPDPTFNNAKFVEALKGNLTSDMLPEDLRAVPKGPADGDIEGYYPNSLKIKQNVVKTIHLFNGAVSLPKLAKPDFEGTSNMMWWNPKSTSEYKWEYSTIKNIIGPTLDNGAIPVWDENAERFKSSIISADEDGALVAGALTVTGATVTNGITNTGDITNSGNIANAGNVAIGGTLDVTGATTLNNTLAVAGDVETTTLTTTDDATIGGNLGVDGNTDLTGTLNVTGATTTHGIDNSGSAITTGTLATTGTATVGTDLTVTRNTTLGTDSKIHKTTVYGDIVFDKTDANSTSVIKDVKKIEGIGGGEITFLTTNEAKFDETTIRMELTGGQNPGVPGIDVKVNHNSPSLNAENIRNNPAPNQDDGAHAIAAVNASTTAAALVAVNDGTLGGRAPAIEAVNISNTNATIVAENTAAGGFALDLQGNLKMKVAAASGNPFNVTAPIMTISANVRINDVGEEGQVVYIVNASGHNRILTTTLAGGIIIKKNEVLQLIYVANHWRVVKGGL